MSSKKWHAQKESIPHLMVLFQRLETDVPKKDFL